MSASVSTIPAVMAQLVAFFKAAVEPSTEVWAARPAEDHQLAENVYLGEVRGNRRFATFPAGRPNSREETYEVQVSVEVQRAGTDIEGAESRMWAIVNAIELPVANSPGLGGLQNVSWSISTHFQQDTKTGPGGVLAAYHFGVAVVARI